MVPLETYSVQPIMGDGTTAKDGTHTLEAPSPLMAGEQALGEPLALNGRRPRAIVRWMNESFVHYCVTLYDPPSVPGTPAST
jgi:hypothetical protein